LLIGGSLALGAVLFSTFGTVLATTLERRGVTVWQKVAWGMAYGGAACLVMAVLRGQELTFSLEPAYLVSLGYLVAFGSVAAFAAYLTLFESIGVGRAGYVGVVVPVVALLVSTVFEGFQPTAWTALGLGFVLAGQVAVARRGS
jgi:drug/metabolite transporter (DMT)-like permease